MMNSKIKEALKRLGYTRKWLDSGILSEKLLLEQYTEIEKYPLEDIDDNEEHYRYNAFDSYLEGKQSISDKEIDSITGVIQEDAESWIFFTYLINSALLTSQQLVWLKHKYPDVIETYSKQYDKALLLQKLKEEGLTQENFEMVKKSMNSTVHRHVLEAYNLTQRQVEWFAEYGNNKAIRNIAKQKL